MIEYDKIPGTVYYSTNWNISESSILRYLLSLWLLFIFGGCLEVLRCLARLCPLARSLSANGVHTPLYFSQVAGYGCTCSLSFGLLF